MPQITSDWTVGVEFVSLPDTQRKRFFNVLIFANLFFYANRTTPLAVVKEPLKEEGTLWPRTILPNSCPCLSSPKLITTQEDPVQVCIFFVYLTVDR